MYQIVVVEPFENDLHYLMKEVGDVRFGDANHRYTETELIELVKDADAIVITSKGNFTKKVIESAKKLKIIAKCGAPPSNVDYESASDNGVVVTWTPGTNATSVAEHALVLMLSSLKMMPQTMKNLKKGKWRSANEKAQELSNKTVGIVGLGQAGFRLAELLKSFHGKVLCFDPYADKERINESGVTPVDFDTLLKNSDLVTLHCHCSEETHHLMNQENLRKMKKNAFLINTGRGPLVDESALLEALEKGWIAGAALDVFEVEPPHKENPLFSLDNVIATPHMAGYTKEALRRDAKQASEEVIKVLKGGQACNVANLDYLKT